MANRNGTSSDQEMAEDRRDEDEPMDQSTSDVPEQMITGDGSMDVSSGPPSEEHQKLLEYGLSEKVVRKLEEIFKTGKLIYSDLDERALDALKEFPVDGALVVLNQFLESSLEHVSNKSAYLCGVMKTYRQKSKIPGGSSGTASGKGPNEEKIKAILERTGYTLDVTTGQRKYGGPPPDWEGSPPSSGCEIFVGKIPKDMFEDELIPLFEKCGKIWDLRLMMDPLTGQNRGYAFITYCERQGAQAATRQLDNYEIKKGKTLKVNVSVPNLRLFVGNIPKSKSKEEIFEEFGKLTAGLTEVIIYSSPDDRKKNRGFCFLEYESHKAASLAKRRLGTGRIKVWGCDIIVDWADPQEEPDSETMSKVKVLYARNLTGDITEAKLKEMFEAFGKVERVKKIKDYAFVHFEERDHAVKAMDDLNGKEIGGSIIEVSLAKPPSDKKKKEEILRNRERRMMQTMQQRAAMMGMPPPSPRGRGSRMPPPLMRSYDYDYDYDYYGYGDYQGGYADPYYEDYYGHYDDYYDYDYAPAPRAPTRGTPERGRGGRGVRGTTTRGPSSGPLLPRGRASAPPPLSRGRGTRGGSRGGGAPAPSPNRGGGRRGNLAGKRKFDGGHQNQGDSKRRFQTKRAATGGSWGSQPIPQQPLDSSGYNSYRGGHIGGEDQWYQDSYGQQWG
ncbi:heterogeneous nuclear ribonucleoprotein Q [Centruroides vittatus]|uniref:heterogeneous nuclear ribonucleoprotein Q-like n=1 Tax=Centruroides sculpturatus TaxID=218467 RepID=UPI000C6EAE9B|nr:heterogeneous nuclear ribonucleoprotein Q-like [Centruroides sculpturatus]